MEREPHRDPLNRSERSDIDLLGYLLGALSPEEAAEVAARLERDPDLRDAADRLYLSLPKCDATWGGDLPAPGLAERTLAALDRFKAGEQAAADSASDSDRDSLTPEQQEFEAITRRITAWSEETSRAVRSNASEIFASELPSAAEPVVSVASRDRRASERLQTVSGSWGWQDWVAAAAMTALFACLAMPALINSRYHAQLTLCQNNLRSVGRALGDYAAIHRGRLPVGDVGTPLEPVGAYAPLLARDHLISDSDVLCPSSPLRDQFASFHIPTLDELQRMKPTALSYMQRMMGGSYGFTLGYSINGKLQELKSEGSPFRVIMADRTDLEAGQWLHAGQGMNVLFDDGHYTFIHEDSPQLLDKQLFVNRLGQLAPGLDPDDSVIAPSQFRRPTLGVSLNY